MYILINKETYTTKVYKDKTEIAQELNISTKTLSRHLNNTNTYNNNTHIVTIPSYIQTKSNRGGKRNNNSRF